MAASLVPKSSFGPRQLEEPRNHRDRVAFTDEIASSLSLSLSFVTSLFHSSIYLFHAPIPFSSLRIYTCTFHDNDDNDDGIGSLSKVKSREGGKRRKTNRRRIPREKEREEGREKEHRTTSRRHRWPV